MDWGILVALLAAAVQSGTPVLFATLGEMLSEKGGVLNLGVEGMMSVAALAAFLTAYFTGSPWLGFLAGGLAGACLASLHGVICVGFLGNQVVSGLALTILGLGLTHFFGTPYIGLAAPGFSKFAVPGLADLPVLGGILFRQDALVYVSYVLPVAFWFFLQRTRPGLAVRAVGEMPAAV
ncbi:MAG TPA: ABC transporter permease, partial [Desulfovibrio sp.]|nr:ABC transporter permease [Desulfovibrio sp.]